MDIRQSLVEVFAKNESTQRLSRFFQIYEHLVILEGALEVAGNTQPSALAFMSIIEDILKVKEMKEEEIK